MEKEKKHRDLKLENIMLPKDRSGEEMAKVLDFGIAKLLDPGSVDYTVVETGTALRLLTPAYASPEQVTGEPIGTGSDVYSIGLLAYRLLTGKHPFAGKQRQELAREITATAPTAPSRRRARRSRRGPRPPPSARCRRAGPPGAPRVVDP